MTKTITTSIHDALLDAGNNSAIGGIDLIIDSPLSKPDRFYILGDDGQYYRVMIEKIDEVNIV